MIASKQKILAYIFTYWRDNNMFWVFAQRTYSRCSHQRTSSGCSDQSSRLAAHPRCEPRMGCETRRSVRTPRKYFWARTPGTCYYPFINQIYNYVRPSVNNVFYGLCSIVYYRLYMAARRLSKKMYKIQKSQVYKKSKNYKKPKITKYELCDLYILQNKVCYLFSKSSNI